MAKQLELFHWWFHDDKTGQRRRTPYAMDRETATGLYGNVQPDETTRVLRAIAERGDSAAISEPPRNLPAMDAPNLQNAMPAQ
jgi:hypothetical protein